MKTSTRLFLLACLSLSSAARAQYCMLPGRTPYSTEQPGITSFKLNTINRSSINVESASTVVVVTNDSTTLVRGQSYTITLMDSEDATNFPGARNNIRIWIDYNKNFSFDDAGETVLTMDFHPHGTYTGTFTVPATAPLGTTTLRATAKMSSDAGHTTPTSCDNPADPLGYHGEIEDYKVKIVSATGVNEVQQTSPVISVAPNPSAGHVSVSLDGALKGDVVIAMYDITGKKIADVYHGKWMTTYDFDLNTYTSAAGIYFIKVSSGQFSAYQKLLKVN